VVASKNIQTYKYGEKQQKAKEKKRRASVGYMSLCYTR